MDVSKLIKALGKRRMAKVEDIMVGASWVDIQLTNGEGDVWDFMDYSESEIVFYAKRFIDEGGHI
jgi:hypothetical protein